MAFLTSLQQNIIVFPERKESLLVVLANCKVLEINFVMNTRNGSNSFKQQRQKTMCQPVQCKHKHKHKQCDGINWHNTGIRTKPFKSLNNILPRHIFLTFYPIYDLL